MDMDLVRNAIDKLELRIAGSGSEDAIVTLIADPDVIYCQYEKGACIRAAYGGRSAEFITADPVVAKTRIGFMFGATLGSLSQRAAAAAIMNVVTGFFGISRVLRSCDPACHRECLAALRAEIGSGRIFPVGIHGNVQVKLGSTAGSPEEADVILVVGDGMIAEGTGDLVVRYAGKKRIYLLGPSTAGVSALEGCRHWCPFGKG
jgi:hypothetical protein